MNLIERFDRYTPPEELIKYMGATVSAIRVDKEKRIMELDISSDIIIPKKILYRLEAEIKDAYKLNGFVMYPKYHSSLYTSDYIDDLILETYRVGAVSKGFFDDYSITSNNGELIIKVPLIQGGIELLNVGKTADVISGIIKKEFNVNVSVKIQQREDYKRNIELFEAEKLEILKRALEQANGNKSTNQPVKKQEDSYQALKGDYKKSNSFSEKSNPVVNNGTTIKAGHITFDLTGKEYIVGEPFEIDNIIPIRDLKNGMHKACVLGKVFEINEKTIKRGSVSIITVGFTDNDASIYIKITANSSNRDEEMSRFKVGCAYMIRANSKIDDFDGELYLTYLDVFKVSTIERTDNAENKRVELHLHTMMSQMDGTIDPEKIVSTAKAWGHRAVAITDHGNVQAFPPVMLAAEKQGLNIIYGMEAYFVDDTAKAIFGTQEATFEDEFCVFDIETTGLSNINDKITEIGAVIIKDGEIIDTFNELINPQMPIPARITELTGITDEMVKNARTIDKVLPDFIKFVGDRILVAHNANFDTGFIRKTCKDLGIQFNFTYLDTLALSRFINSDLKRHNLDVLANYYNLGEFNHHRACDDAEMLANILFRMFEKLKNEGIENTSRMSTAMSENVDPLKLKSYHQIILVKNKKGLKNLYKLVSDGFLTYFMKHPRIPKTRLNEMREGLIIGSACEAGELFQAILENRSEEDIEEIAKFYDYLEIQPLCNNMFLVNEGRATIDDLKRFNIRIVELGKKLGKPVVATCDAHFLNKEDEICRKILPIVQNSKDADAESGLYFRTTEEMLAEFEYLGKEQAYEVVVTNTNLIADMIQYEEIRPFPKGTFTPNMPGAEEDLQNMCWDRARSMYEYNGKIPEIVSERLDKELTSIIKNGFAVLYIIAQKLVNYSESLGYQVGSRGSVGSSFVATMAGISEVNPLQPHYRCPNCRYSEFITDGSVGSGFDLENKNCPHCNTKMAQDGHDIPFETFLGFKGDKSPDIDLNFSGDVQGQVHKYTEDLFGEENVFRAGTVGAIAPKTAQMFIEKFMKAKNINVNPAEIQRVVTLCTGIKRTTGQHPGGIVVVPKEYEIFDFCPVQHPADDAGSNIITTHFTFEYLHDTLLKLDELGHDIPTKYKAIEQFTNTSVNDVPMNDPKVYELFLSTEPLGSKNLLDDLNCKVGTYGLPEFGTRFVQQMLVDAKPQNFSDLLQISGLSHGTDVWLGNAQDLIKAGTCTISNVVGTRDSIMLYLIYRGLEKGLAFKIMEDVRKGKGLKPEYEQAMIENNIPAWYISSCKKIKYMFPKAHAAAYVISAIRLGWYKVHMPLEFYAAYLSVAPGGFEASMVENGKRGILEKLKEIEDKGTDATQKEKEMIVALQMAYECIARGIEFLPVDLMKSDSFKFLPENGKIRMPFSSIAGIGENAAIKIKEARDSNEIYSVEDFQQKTMLSKTVMETLEKNHVFENLAKTNQLSLFD